MAERQRLKFFTALGNGNGASTLKADGSVTPVIRKLSVPAGADHTKVQRVELYGEGGTATDADGTYFNGFVALATGLQVGIFRESDDSIVNDLMAHINAAFPAAGFGKAIADFVAAGWKYEETGFTAGDTIVVISRDFTNDPLIVNAGQYLGVVVNDDLTGAGFTNHDSSYVSHDF